MTREATRVAQAIRDRHRDCPPDGCGLRLLTTEDVVEIWRESLRLPPAEKESSQKLPQPVDTPGSMP